MKHSVKAFLLIIMAMSYSTVVTAQVEMADVMRSNGKIYVVVVVALIVMLGLLIYLISLDRKISALEKKVKNKSGQ